MLSTRMRVVVCVRKKCTYNLLLDSDDHVIKIVERNVDIDSSFVFKNVSDKLIDKFSRDAMYRIIHEILPVNILMFKYNISKTYKCVFCNEVETLRHLFFNVLLTHNCYY